MLFAFSVPSGVIVGATFGSILALAAIFFLLMFFLKKHHRGRNIISPADLEMKIGSQHIGVKEKVDLLKQERSRLHEMPVQ